ncbi:Rrp17 protein [Martiniozyma asiatica (nom. inval.)]|nr:Rrp17 protein [Martiniozyma asiatica]
MPKPNREILTGGKKYKDAKKNKHRVEEVTFDMDSRKEYLTGFHKRKEQRKKSALKHVTEMQRQERIQERARIREDRREMVRKKLEEMKEASELNPFLKDVYSDEENEEGADEKKEKKSEKKSKKNVGWLADSSDDESDASWNGIEEEKAEESDENEQEANDNDSDSDKNNFRGILKKQIYDIENDDAPVSGHSEVVIESLDNPNAEVTPYISLTTVAEKMNVNLDKSDEILDKSIKRAKKYARLMGVAENSEEGVTKPKQKKKKFRYLSKTERKQRTLKEKAVAAKRGKKNFK